MSKIDTDYKLIPMDKITDEAREIAVRWVDGYERNGEDIPNKHKLASDIMNYARRHAWESHESELAEILVQLNKAHNLLAKSEMPMEPYNAISKILAAVKLNLAEIINH